MFIRLLLASLVFCPTVHGKVGACTGSLMDTIGCRPKRYQFIKTARLPHDAASYTQGLVLHAGSLYESSGRVGHCRITKSSLKTNSKDFSLKKNWAHTNKSQSNFFCEGLTYHPETAEWIQLTWKAGIAFFYKENKGKLTQTRSQPYQGEGWGLEYCDGKLYLSDGSNSLKVVDSKTMKTKEVIPVTFQGSPLYNINELACAKGGLYANVYHSNRIVHISPASGIVNHYIEISVKELLGSDQWSKLKPDEVLNGIAWSKKNQQLFLTGKHWPFLFVGQVKKSS